MVIELEDPLGTIVLIDGAFIFGGIVAAIIVIVELATE